MKTKKTLLLFISLCVFGVTFAQSKKEYTCSRGLTYEISKYACWGKNQPIVLSVIPYSPANISGLEPGDIIESVDNVKTTGKSAEEIRNMLEKNAEIVLEVTNLKEQNRETLLSKNCRLSRSINEDQLASAYSFYSLESTSNRSFTCPFKTIPGETFDYLRYKSFTFGTVYEKNYKLEEFINQQLTKVLTNKGLVYAPDTASLLVQTFYSLERNPDYKGEKKNILTEFRYNVYTKKMERLPIYYNVQIDPKNIPFQLNFGIRLVDRKTLKTIWECEAKEWLSGSYKMEDYAYIHIPLILMQYPYAKTLGTANFLNTKKKYNFTGISYNINNIQEIIDVDIFSPAYQSGIKTGDIIEKINGMKLDASPEKFSKTYKKFIQNTSNMRDTSLIYTDANGFNPCMYWSKAKYRDIAKAFSKQDNLTAFSYLFYFETFINPSEKNVLYFDIIRKNEKKKVRIKPTVVEVEALDTF